MTPQSFLPPASLTSRAVEEIEKRQQELKHIELFLDFNLQAVRSHIALLEQQKTLMSTAENMAKGFYGGSEKDEEKQ